MRANGAGGFQPPPRWTLGPERTCSWVDMDLWFMRSGYGTVETPDGMFDLLPGSCLLMRGGEPYIFDPNFEHPFLHYWVHFDCFDHDGRAIAPADAPLPRRFRQLEEPQFMNDLLERVVVRFENDARGEADFWLRVAVAELARNDAATDTRNETRTDQQMRIDRLCRKIEDRPYESWTVADLAREFCGSRSHLYRAFVERTGFSPQQFVIDVRMRHARMLLTESDNSIGWIAEQLGYRDLFFFSRQFKQLHGCSPSAFRQKGNRVVPGSN